MNILWDMRLYSYGYRNRGVGAYCTNVATALLPHLETARIHIWGDPDQIPERFKTGTTTIIPYTKSTWKQSIHTIPKIVLQYRIDLVHYWVALGPLHSIGLSPFPLAPAIATIHDLGVEKWNTPFGNAVQKSLYWKAQKIFFKMVDGVLCNSIATRKDVRSHLKSTVPDMVVYPPYPPMINTSEQKTKPREPFFITLGGSPHKNVSRTIAAFLKFRKQFPHYSLKILGDLNPAEEQVADLPEGITHEPAMNNYYTYLNTCSGLLSLSLYEGLGIPPIEALSYSCPLLLSSIPSHNETCSDAALFADPTNIDGIAEAMAALAGNTISHAGFAGVGYRRYQTLARKSIKNSSAFYRHFTSSKLRSEHTL